MDNKNVFVAIALSMSVLLFWGAFFETPRKTVEQNNTQQVEQNNNKSSIAPTINQPITIKKVTREEAINKSKRIRIENDNVIGSLSLAGALIDDISFKKHKQKLWILKHVKVQRLLFVCNFMVKFRLKTASKSLQEHGRRFKDAPWLRT